MSSPDDIQQQIERTRQALSSDVDRLSEKVSPGKAVGRRVDSVKSGARSVKEKVMGVSDSAAQSFDGSVGSVNAAAESAGSTLSSAASSTIDAVTSAATQTGDLLSNAPQQARKQAQGNPVAAGVVAFGVGWLISSLLPPTQREQQLAGKAEEKGQQLAHPLKDMAQDIAGNLQEPVQQAFDEVKRTAADAAHETTEQARAAADDVKKPLQDMPAAVQGASGPWESPPSRY